MSLRINFLECVSQSHQWLTPRFPRSKKLRWSPTEVWLYQPGFLPRLPPHSSSRSSSSLSYSGCTSGRNARTSAPSAPWPPAPSAAPAPRRLRPRRGDRRRWTAPAAGTARYPRSQVRSCSSSRSYMPLCCSCLRAAAAGFITITIKTWNPRFGNILWPQSSAPHPDIVVKAGGSPRAWVQIVRPNASYQLHTSFDLSRGGVQMGPGGTLNNLLTQQTVLMCF